MIDNPEVPKNTKIKILTFFLEHSIPRILKEEHDEFRKTLDESYKELV